MRLLVLGGALVLLLSPIGALARDLKPVASNGAKAAELRLEVKPRHLVLRRIESATLYLRLPEGESLEATGSVRVKVNSGLANDPVLEEDGRYRIDYVLPEVGYPHFALILASVPLPGGEAVAAFRVPLSGIARVMVDTIPGARVYGVIAGRQAGPFIADRAGEVELRLPARPGETTATIRAKDATGAARGRTMQLPTPPQNRVVALLGLNSGEEKSTLGFWLYTRGGKSARERLRVTSDLGGSLKPEAVEGGLSRVDLPDRSLAGWDAITVKVRLRRDPVSRADLSVPVPENERGPGLLLLSTEKGPPEGLVDALREAGVRPRIFRTTEPFSEKAGRLLVERAEAAAAWTEGDPPKAVLVMARPGEGGMIEERFESKERDPARRWASLAEKLREAMSRPPKPPEPEVVATVVPPRPDLPPLPQATTAVCEVHALPWWPHQAFALRFGLAPKLALGGGGLGGNFSVGAEFRSHLRVTGRPHWLSDLRVLTGAFLSVDSAERIVGDRLGIWLRGRYFGLDVAALLPFESRFDRLVLLGPRLAFRIGQIKMKPAVVDGYLAPEAQLAADLAVGAEARFRLRRIEMGAGAALEIPLTALTVLPPSSQRLLHRQLRLRVDFRVAYSF